MDTQGQEPSQTPKTSAENPLGRSLDEMREEVWATAQGNHLGLSKEEFLEMSDCFGF